MEKSQGSSSLLLFLFRGTRFVFIRPCCLFVRGCDASLLLCSALTCLQAACLRLVPDANALPGEPGNKSVVRLGFAWWPFVPVSSQSLSLAQRTRHLTPGGQAPSFIPKSLGTPKARPPAAPPPASALHRCPACLPTRLLLSVLLLPLSTHSTSIHSHGELFYWPPPHRILGLFISPICLAASRAFYAPSRNETSQRALPRRTVVAFAFDSSTRPSLEARVPLSNLPPPPSRLPT